MRPGLSLTVDKRSTDGWRGTACFPESAGQSHHAARGATGLSDGSNSGVRIRFIGPDLGASWANRDPRIRMFILRYVSELTRGRKEVRDFSLCFCGEGEK